MNSRQLRLLIMLMAALSAACRREAPLPKEHAADRLMIGVTADGLYRLPLADMQAAGLAIHTLDVKNLQLTQDGAAIPYLLQDDALLFYGQATDSRYTSTRSYLLQTGQPGTLMTETTINYAPPAATAVNQTITLAENSLYEAQALDEQHADPWFWQKIGRRQAVDIPLELPSGGDGSGQLRLQLWGQTHSPDVENDHDLDLLINGRAVETIRWDGPVYHEATVFLPPGTLQPGQNTITLSNEARGAALLDIMMLNWLALDVPTAPLAQDDELNFHLNEAAAVTITGLSAEPIVLDIHNPANPVRLAGHFTDGQMTVAVTPAMKITAVAPQAFHAPHSLALARASRWRQPDNQADLIIITTDTLAPALAPLVTARQTQGLTVAVVPVAEIYDDFGFGAASPESIRQFVTYAAANWQDPQPRYLFLVGEATTDYRGYASQLPTNHVPTMLVPVEYSGETASDSRLADIDNDGKPELAVGRWPVDTVKEVESLVTRTLAYEAGTATAHALFTTDASEAEFAAMAQRLWSGSQVPDTAVIHLNGGAANDVVAAWNDGTWLVTYIGHGSLELWGKDNLFNHKAVGDLQPGQPPIVIQLTCLTGLFAQPGVEALAEVMLQHKNGPVLTIAATSLTLSTHQEPFAAALLQHLTDPNIRRIGEAFQEAKNALDVHSGGLREISDTFVLLGDPSTLIVRPENP